MTPDVRFARGADECVRPTLTPMATASRPISSLRWWIGGLLFASTVINYIDRQTLSLLAPYLKLEYHWTNTDYANLAIAFRVAYSIGPERVRQDDRPRRHTARAHRNRNLLFHDFDVDFAGERFLQLRDLPVSAGRGRIGELAGCDKGGVGMVSEARAGAGDGPIRQRIVDWRGGCSVHRARESIFDGDGVQRCDSGRAGFSLADRVAMAVLSAGDAQPDQPGGARNDRG